MDAELDEAFRETPRLAARLVRRNLKMGPPSLVQLLYKLDPENFEREADVTRLIRFLEDSPLNKQPLPEAGNRIGAYYRRLRQKPHESVRQFIVREEKVHDEMLKALQRLLRERDLDFDQYDCSVGELKLFVGMKDGASVFSGGDDSSETRRDEEASFQDGHSGGSQAPRGEGRPAEEDEKESEAGHSTPSVKTAKGKDFLQRLMEKGLMPLSALDVIRGWLLLETCIQEMRMESAWSRRQPGTS